MNQHVLTGIGELIDRINNAKINNPEISKLLYEAADKLEVLFDYIVDSENNSLLCVYRLELELSAKQADIDYLESRLDASDIGYVSHD